MFDGDAGNVLKLMPADDALVIPPGKEPQVALYFPLMHDGSHGSHLAGAVVLALDYGDVAGDSSPAGTCMKQSIRVVGAASLTMGSSHIPLRIALLVEVAEETLPLLPIMTATHRDLSPAATRHKIDSDDEVVFSVVFSTGSPDLADSYLDLGHDDLSEGEVITYCRGRDLET